MEGNRGTFLHHLRQVGLCYKKKVAWLHLYVTKNGIKKQTSAYLPLFCTTLSKKLLKVADLSTGCPSRLPSAVDRQMYLEIQGPKLPKIVSDFLSNSVEFLCLSYFERNNIIGESLYYALYNMKLN